MLISGFAAIGVLVTTPRFPDHLLPNHTHLGSYTRVVSLHRVVSRSHDSRISLRIHPRVYCRSPLPAQQEHG